MDRRSARYDDSSSIDPAQSAVLIGLKGFDGTCVDFSDVTRCVKLTIETNQSTDPHCLRRIGGPDGVEDISRTVGLRVVMR
jgi:hypothetical protein